jgi:hypothetical protein
MDEVVSKGSLRILNLNFQNQTNVQVLLHGNVDHNGQLVKHLVVEE